MVEGAGGGEDAEQADDGGHNGLCHGRGDPFVHGEARPERWAAGSVYEAEFAEGFGGFVAFFVVRNGADFAASVEGDAVGWVAKGENLFEWIQVEAGLRFQAGFAEEGWRESGGLGGDGDHRYIGLPGEFRHGARGGVAVAAVGVIEKEKNAAVFQGIWFAVDCDLGGGFGTGLMHDGESVAGAGADGQDGRQDYGASEICGGSRPESGQERGY